MSKYTLSLVEGCDQGIYANSLRDVYVVKGDDIPLFKLTYNYAGDDGDDSAVCTRLSPMHAEELPSIMSGIDLLGTIYAYLCDEISDAGSEFFADLFIDSEGDSHDIPLPFMNL